MIYGSQRAFMSVELTEEELRLIDPDAYMEKYNRTTAEQPNYQARVILPKSEIDMLTSFDKGEASDEN